MAGFNVGLLEAALTADATQYDRALVEAKKRGEQAAQAIARNFRREGGRLRSLGDELTKFVTLPLIAAGTASHRRGEDR